MAGDIRLANALAIKGWMSPVELKWLGETARNCEIIIEVGSYKGRSAAVLAENSCGRLYCVDPWYDVYYKNDGTVLLRIGDEIYHEFLNNTSRYNNIITYRGTLQKFEQNDIIKNADFVFIDGDHREEAVRLDIQSALNLTKRNSFIAGHDYTHQDWPAVRQVVDEIFPEHNRVDSIWWIQKS